VAIQQPWWKTTPVYQIYPRSFRDANGDGIGDLPGIIEKLDYVKSVGAGAIWLSPVFASPNDDNGYDISDYYAIAPEFGTMEDMDRLIAELDARDMRLLLDLVVNHTSDEHEWFRRARSSRDDPYHDFYIFREGRNGNTEPPNNWGSMFGGSAWEYNEPTDEWYLHLFSRKQPDLNWDNPEVRAEVYRMMRFWLERGADGFRMDVINFVGKPVGLPDAPNPGGERFVVCPELWANQPATHLYLKEMAREVLRPAGAASVGEAHATSVEEALLYVDPVREELDMIFQFEHMKADEGDYGKYDPRPLDLPALKQAMSRWQRWLAGHGWNTLFTGNHDQARIVSRWGDEGVPAGAGGNRRGPAGNAAGGAGNRGDPAGTAAGAGWNAPAGGSGTVRGAGGAPDETGKAGAAAEAPNAPVSGSGPVRERGGAPDEAGKAGAGGAASRPPASSSEPARGGAGAGNEPGKAGAGGNAAGAAGKPAAADTAGAVGSSEETSEASDHRRASACAIAMAIYLHQGTPFLYQGEEIGMVNARFDSREQYQDIEAHHAYAECLRAGLSEDDALRRLAERSRDNARTPMQWNAEPGAGFTEGTPWIELNPRYREINVADEEARPDGVLAFYRRLFAARAEHPVFTEGEFELLLPDDPQVYAYVRRAEPAERTGGAAAGQAATEGVTAGAPDGAAAAKGGDGEERTTPADSSQPQASGSASEALVVCNLSRREAPAPLGFAGDDPAALEQAGWRVLLSVYDEPPQWDQAEGVLRLRPFDGVVYIRGGER